MLKQDMAALRLMFEPWNTAPHGPVIWEPEPSDPNAQFKRDFITKAREVIVAGDKALAGVSFKVPRLGEQDFEAIQDVLANDPEQRDFIALAAACERVIRSLVQDAA